MVFTNAVYSLLGMFGSDGAFSRSCCTSPGGLNNINENYLKIHPQQRPPLRYTISSINAYTTDSYYDSPPQNNNSDFSLTSVSWLLHTHEEGCYAKKYLHIRSCLQKTVERWRPDGKGRRILGIRPPGAGFKTGDFVQEKLGGGGGYRRMTSYVLLETCHIDWASG